MASSVPISVLLVGLIARSKEIELALREGGSENTHQVIKAGNCREAGKLLRRKKVTVVLSDEVLVDGTWQSILEKTRALASKPPVVVCSRIADERLWAEVLNLGAFDMLLTEPVEENELLYVVGAAHRSCPQVRRQSQTAAC
jgi:DNA-binding response OmpR family regulator